MAWPLIAGCPPRAESLEVPDQGEIPARCPPEFRRKRQLSGGGTFSTAHDTISLLSMALEEWSVPRLKISEDSVDWKWRSLLSKFYSRLGGAWLGISCFVLFLTPILWPQSIFNQMPRPLVLRSARQKCQLIIMWQQFRPQKQVKWSLKAWGLAWKRSFTRDR